MTVKKTKQRRTTYADCVALDDALNSTFGALQAKKDDPVNPRHYADLAVPPVEAIEAWGLGFCLGNCVKYIARAGKKTPDVLTDLKKAAWYLDHEVKRLEKK